MTPLERAHEIVDKTRQGFGLYSGDLYSLIEQAIKAAIEEERAACEEIAQMYANLIREAGFPEKGAAELIRNAIIKRARANLP